MSPALASWSRALLIVLWLLVGWSVVVVGFAAVVIAVDESRHSDELDGLGTFIGLILGGFALLMALILGVIVFLAQTARRRGSHRRLVAATSIASVLAVAFLLWGFSMTVGGPPTGSASADTVATVVVPAIALLVPAVGTLVALGADQRGRSPV